MNFTPPRLVPILTFAALSLGAAARAAEYHVAVTGDDAHPGSAAKPLKTISAAAAKAMPGDTVTVHAGTYRERVTPPRGGTSNTKRITYQAAPGEKVTITGSEPTKGWEKVSGDTWKLTLPNSYFGAFNPFAEKVHGDWFSPQGRVHHRGCVYLGKDWLVEAANLATVLQPAGKTPLWFAQVDGVVEGGPEFLMNLATFTPGGGAAVTMDKSTAKHGTELAPCSEGGQCAGFIRRGNWLQFDNVDFGAGTESIVFRASVHPAAAGGEIEVRADKPDGDLLGTARITVTGSWEKWQDFTAKIKRTAGKKTLCLVFKPERPANTGTDNTVIHAQFPGVNPNESPVEINVRPTVFTPDKTNIDYITVRGFDLRNAATNWAPPTAGQIGLITAYWCKGWIIENNEISNSRCSGVALGKYADQWDGKRGTTDGYYLTIDDALKKDGWTKEKIGGHVVRNNHIHHCEQTGIVGSLGCAFSRIENNEIHDIHIQGIWGGAEMAGIKFHGALDVIISGNHIYRCGEAGGIWLDWMAQGTQVVGNLMHDNLRDLFAEVDHGPYLVANNIFLSHTAHLANSRGGAYVHNLVAGNLVILHDDRRTPWCEPHGTQTLGLHNCPIGDVRWFNNLLASRCNLNAYDGAVLPVSAAGNVFTKGAVASKFDEKSVLQPDFDAAPVLTQKPDGWYLELNADPAWRASVKRPIITSAMLGKAKIPNLPYENPDGSPVKISTDYFGKSRDTGGPFPGPFETVKDGKQVLKVWPKS